MKLLYVLTSLLLASAAADAQISRSWRPTNGPYSEGFAEVTEIITDHRGWIFASTFGQGVYRSTDNGAHWSRFGRTFPNPFLNTIAADSTGTLYAGGRMGVSRSTDGGTTWTPVNKGIEQDEITALAVNREGVVFAGTDDSTLLRSTDKGATWQRAAVSASFGRPFYTLMVLPNGMLYAGPDRGAFLFSPEGENAVPVAVPGTQSSVTALATNSRGTLYLGMYDRGIFSSIDSGRAWRPIGLQGKVVRHIVAVDGILYASTSRLNGTGDTIFRSTNEGKDWAPLLASPPDNTSGPLGVTPTGKLLAGIWRNWIVTSADSGRTWREDALVAAGIQELHGNSRGELLASTINDLFITTNGGARWDSLPKPWSQVYVSLIDSGGAILASTPEGLFRTINRGTSWEPQGSFSPTAMTIGPGNTIFAVADTSIYRSSDRGLTWEHFPVDTIAAPPGLLTMIGVGPQGDIWVGARHGIYRSLDGGGSWTLLTPDGLDYTFDFAFAPDGTIFVGTTAGILRSTDKGNSWVMLAGELQRRNFANLHWQEGELMAVGSDSLYATDLFASSDNGLSWTPYNKGLAQQIAGPLATAGSALYAGTDAGVFILSDISFSVEREEKLEHDAAMMSLSCIPNPATGKTWLHLKLRSGGIATVTLYDAMGNEVASLAAGSMDAGEHRFPVDAGILPAGTYYCVARTSTASATGRLVVVR